MDSIRLSFSTLPFFGFISGSSRSVCARSGLPGTALGLALLLFTLQAANAEGLVTAEISRGTLVLRGDDAANGVILRATNGYGPVFDIEGFDGTLINGQAELLGVYIDRDIKIDLGDGDNALMITGVGDDITWPVFLPPRKLSVVTGDGDDVVVLDHVEAQDKLSIHTGAGADTVTFVRCLLSGRSTSIVTGDGDDSVILESSDMHGKMLANLGADEDHLIALTSGFLGKANVILGSGDDIVGLSDTQFVRRSKINGGKGDDSYRQQESDTTDARTLKAFEDEDPDLDEEDILAIVQNDPGLGITTGLLLFEGSGFVRGGPN